MNYHLLNLLLLVSMLVVIPALADTDDIKLQKKNTSSRVTSTPNLVDSIQTDELYFIQLKDSALASYTGNLDGLSATSLNTTENKTTSGLLDVHSHSSRQYTDYLQTKQDSFAAKANRLLNRSLEIKYRYKIILNAVAARLSSKEAKLLAKQPDVLRVQPAGMHYIQTDSGPGFIGASQVWTGSDEFIGTQGEGVIIGILDTGINAYHPSFADIGADGYDHTNPWGQGNYIGDCVQFAKFCNDKLIGIVSWPVIRNNLPPVLTDNYEELSDKLRVGWDFNSHGSHVASIAAGNFLKDVNYYLSGTDLIGSLNEKSNFTFSQISGVAPHANIVSYQVCTSNRGCFPELTLLAIENAIINGVNVINYSVGGSATDPWSDIDSLAFLNARAAGIHVATSAGNSGPDAATISSPANSPWLTSVAAFTHDRQFTEKALTNFSGGNSIPTEIIGKGATAGYTGEVVLAEDYGDAGCLTPFRQGTFAGEIVVCERGDIARVRKGLNVLEGGAGGLILINLDDGAQNIVADNHVLPAIHIAASDGQLLLSWLSSGRNHIATITASELTSAPELGDIVAGFSSRGPSNPIANIFAPDIGAPGVDIYAAAAEETPFTERDEGIPYVSLSGTSMASPHVAGALALLYASHPDWSPAQAQSAIMSTARQVTFKADDANDLTERSTFFEQGAGSIRINRAIKAGLLLDISKQEYIESDPSIGGDPKKLNTTSMVDHNCLGQCSWQRTVTATIDGTWTASYDYLNPGFTLNVSPSNFSLRAGESQTLIITANSAPGLVDEWVHGYVNLNSSNEQANQSHLQVTVGFKAGVMPEEAFGVFSNDNNMVLIPQIMTSGSSTIQAKGYGLYQATQVTGSALGAANDGERANPELYLETTFTIPISVNQGAKRLVVEITNSTAPDMDLYVGRDEDNDGQPGWFEMFHSLVCVSGNTNSVERCIIKEPIPGNYWLTAHNFEGRIAGQPDLVTIEHTQVTDQIPASFEIDIPRMVNEDEVISASLTINGFKDPSGSIGGLRKDNTYYGVVELGSTRELDKDIGSTLVKVVATENQIINNAPMGPSTAIPNFNFATGENIQINFADSFSDADGDVLTYSLVGNEELSFDGSILNGSIAQPGTYNLTIRVTDGQTEISVPLTLIVSPQPAEPTAQANTGSSGGGGGGGAMGLILLLLTLALFCRAGKNSTDSCQFSYR